MRQCAQRFLQLNQHLRGLIVAIAQVIAVVVTKLGGDDPLVPMLDNAVANEGLRQVVVSVTLCRIDKVDAQLPGAGQNRYPPQAARIVYPIPLQIARCQYR